MEEEKKLEEATKPEVKKQYVHVLTLGIGSTTRVVTVENDQQAAPKPFVEFVDAFRKGQRSLVWTPTPQNPVFAVRMDSVDWYSYQVSEKAPKA